MQTTLWKKTGVIMLIFSFIFTTYPGVSLAGMVGTQSILAPVARSQQLTEIQQVLARDDVRAQMLELGVNPADVDKRVDGLTDAELAQLSAGIQDMPAGGSIIWVIGVVFIVLLILELVGVTNVFTKI